MPLQIQSFRGHYEIEVESDIFCSEGDQTCTAALFSLFSSTHFLLGRRSAPYDGWSGLSSGACEKTEKFLSCLIERESDRSSLPVWLVRERRCSPPIYCRERKSIQRASVEAYKFENVGREGRNAVINFEFDTPAISHQSASDDCAQAFRCIHTNSSHSDKRRCAAPRRVVPIDQRSPFSRPFTTNGRNYYPMLERELYN